VAQPTDRFNKPAAKQQPQTSANDRKRLAAHKHLDKMFSEAEGEQIDGRKFWGWIRIDIAFQDGTAGDISASKEARDRLQGGRA